MNIWKVFGKKWLWPNPGINHFPRETEKPQHTMQDDRCPCRDSNRGPSVFQILVKCYRYSKIFVVGVGVGSGRLILSVLPTLGSILVPFLHLHLSCPNGLFLSLALHSPYWVRMRSQCSTQVGSSRHEPFRCTLYRKPTGKNHAAEPFWKVNSLRVNTPRFQPNPKLQ
jgi:hypothetical protein